LILPAGSVDTAPKDHRFMSTTLDVEKPHAGPSAALLQDHVPDWLRAPRAVVGFAMLIGALHWCYSIQRLHHTDLWGHLAYGRLISTAHTLPATEPLMPLAEGVPFIDTAWLTQILGFQMFSQWGASGIQFLHAAAISVCLTLLAWGCFRRTHSFGFTVAGIMMLEILNWYQFQIVRPQLAGLVCFSVLATLISSRRWRPIYWLAIPATIAVWANMHGSFIVGLALLACATVGRAIDVWRRTGQFSAARSDVHTRRLLLTTELAAVAALVNPYGLRLYAEVLSFSSNPNLQSLIEWDPLNFRTVQGQLTAVAGLALAVVYRLSPRRVPAGEALALVALGAAALWSARFLVWWAPLAAACFTIHAHAAWRRFHPLPGPATTLVRTGKWTAITGGVMWICLAWTPFGIQVLHGKSVDFNKSVSKDTPIAAVEWLQEHPPAGQIFNSYEWGDYLVWAGPQNLKVFVTSQAHLVPREVWRDYMTVINLGSNWEEVFDRYGIDTIVVDQADRAALISKLKEDAHWLRTCEDGLAVIFTRRGATAKIEK
jgi:hypothetical protein